MSARSHRAAALLAVLLAGGCGAGGGAQPPAPSPALTALIADLASGDVAAVCAALTSGAATQLAGEFGGRTCSQTVGTAARYVGLRQGERQAVAAARVLPAMDVPLSPAPYRDGATVARLRVSFDDPVLAEPQSFDVDLRWAAGRWRVSGGLDALFTLLAPA
jgi:hypothetical protein